MAAKGEANGRSKLTTEQIQVIRSSTDGCVKLSRLFKVNKKTIQRIRNGELWASV